MTRRGGGHAGHGLAATAQRQEDCTPSAGMVTCALRQEGRQRLSVSALAITLTLDSAMAAPATTGLR